MSNYRITPTQMAVHPEGADYSDPDATIVTLLGELGEDEHFSVRQGEHVIYLDPEEIPALAEACQRLLSQRTERPAAEQEPVAEPVDLPAAEAQEALIRQHAAPSPEPSFACDPGHSLSVGWLP